MNYFDYLNPFHRNMADAKFRTKSGFPLEANGVLPTTPVQTDSAATPIIVPFSAPRHGFPGIPPVAAPNSLSEPAEAIAAPVQTEPALPRRQTSRAATADHATSVRRRPSCAEHTISGTGVLRKKLLGSFLLLTIAMASGAVWWAESDRNDRNIPLIVASLSQPDLVSFKEVTANKAASAVAVNAAPAAEAPEQEQVHATGTASIPLAQPNEVAAKATQLPTDTPGSASVVSEQALTEIPQVPDATSVAVSKAPTTTKIAKAEPIASVKKPTIARKKVRVDEISRLQVQAFSETKKDRLENSKNDAENPRPAYRFDPQSMKRNSYNTKRARIVAVKARPAYSDCLHNSNFFHREQCKWRACGGKWGQNGCPSYAYVRADPSSY